MQEQDDDEVVEYLREAMQHMNPRNHDSLLTVAFEGVDDPLYILEQYLNWGRQLRFGSPPRKSPSAGVTKRQRPSAAVSEAICLD